MKNKNYFFSKIGIALTAACCLAGHTPIAHALTLESRKATVEAVTDENPEDQVVEVVSLKDFQSKNPDLYETYLYTGEAVVAYVDRSVQPAVYYLVDAEGGVQFKDEWGVLGETTYAVGDRLTRFTVGVTAAFGANTIYPFAPDAQVVSQGNVVQPVEATIAQIKASPATYYSRLVSVPDVTLSVPEGTTQFTEGMPQPTFTDAEGQTGKMRVLKGTDLIGTDIPTTPLTLVGLMTSKAVTSGPILAPRGAGDLQVSAVAEPSIEVDIASFPEARGRVGEKVEIGTVHVKAVAMPQEVSIVPSGAVEGIFTTNVTTLPKGTYEKDITIYYEAKAIGKHKGNLFFMVGEDPYAKISISGMAIDPKNPPAVQVNPQTLEPFAVKVGESVQQTVKVTPVGMPDYVKVSITPGQGFTTNTTMLMTQGEQNLTVTFRPKAAGEYAATVTIQNEFVEPIEIHLTGTATDEPVAPEVEGDALPLSTDNPQLLLNETFDAGEHNKPLKMEGWKNLAQTGTRAWWGYTFPDYETENRGEKVAKVTAYDSKATEELPCEMLLVTPPLNYKESASKLFTFRVMGNNLTDNMTDKLELCYIYLDGDQMMVEPLNEVLMPAMKDLNDEWQEFHVDLANQNIEDVFFMGFRFKSMRGSSHSAVYYVDDVTYGRTDVPLISTSQLTVDMPGNKENAVVQSAPIEVEGSNLNEPIKLALGGANKDKFELSAQLLEPTGGVFNVRFSGKMGNYEAYVKLSSRGAADKYIFLFASVTQGVESFVIDADAHLTVTDLSGRHVRTLTGAALDKALDNLPSGTYIVTVSTEKGTRSVKMAK